MQVERWSAGRLREAGGPEAVVGQLRQIVPNPPDLARKVREIVIKVKNDGDSALLELIQQYDTGGAQPLPLLVEPERLDEGIQQLSLDMVAGLQVAITNVAEVASAGLDKDVKVVLAQGQSVTLREVPVQSAAVYVPGGMAPYPSTAVMGVVTARAAGVLDVAVCSPPGPDGEIHP
ncbi:MAG TPA: histidinol dehydrogenase, partial [Solirubrobacteraceae bacterium]|nr:histidinol dehydrogenase [Solirubrobacteraceae bacterium]